MDVITKLDTINTITRVILFSTVKFEDLSCS